MHVVQDQWTPLFAAARKGHVEVVRELVQAGAKLNQADEVWSIQLTSPLS